MCLYWARLARKLKPVRNHLVSCRSLNMPTCVRRKCISIAFCTACTLHSRRRNTNQKGATIVNTKNVCEQTIDDVFNKPSFHHYRCHHLRQPTAGNISGKNLSSVVSRNMCNGKLAVLMSLYVRMVVRHMQSVCIAKRNLKGKSATFPLFASTFVDLSQQTARVGDYSCVKKNLRKLARRVGEYGACACMCVRVVFAPGDGDDAILTYINEQSVLVWHRVCSRLRFQFQIETLTQA